MDADAARDWLRYFDDLKDPRTGGPNSRHLLSDLLTITILAVICGAETWTEIELFGHSKLAWLQTFLTLPHAIASHDTFGRVFAMLDPEALERCLTRWFSHLAQSSGGQLIAIDGKTLRGSFDRASGKSAIHMVSAWSQTNRLVLGQVTTEAKSNEITAIPRLLQLLDLQGAIVTIDAMGCQKTIAQQIVKQDADYVLQVKDNHKTLHEDLKLLFDEADAHGWEGMAYAYHQTVEKGHGRVETRRLWCTWDIAWLKLQHDWPGLQCVVCVESIRWIDGKTSSERRYYISSLDGRDAQAMLATVRGHWQIENSLHWSLDVTFGEDDCRLRSGHAAENFSRMRRLALNLLKADQTVKAGLNAKRLKCGWDHPYLLHILKQGC